MTTPKTRLVLLALLLTVAIGNLSAATVFYGGFEDTNQGGDHDYNDVVFSLFSGSNGLTLNGNGSLSNVGLISTINGTPYWNNLSGDSPNTATIGNCLYNGCNTDRGNVPQVPNHLSLQYYAGSGGIAPTSIYFTDTGADTITLFANITADTDKIGYAVCNLLDCSTGVGAVTYLTTSQTFNPCGSGTCSFELAGAVSTNGGSSYASPTYSKLSGGASFQSFAVFSNTTSAVPEPMTFSLMGAGLLGLGLLRKRKKS